MSTFNTVFRYVLLKKNAKFKIRSFHIAPLQARIFFQNVFYQNENFSIRIVDGYMTFAFWAFWFKNPNWTRVHEYMVSESLIGTRCRVVMNLKTMKGLIVGIDEQKRKIHVQLETVAAREEEDEFDDSEEMEDRGSDDVSDATSEDLLDRPFDTNIQQELKEAFSVGNKAERSADVRVPIGKSKVGDPPPEMNRPGDEVIRTFDAGDVRIRSKPGRIQLHINGMRFSVYNATGKYRDLVDHNAVPKQTTNPIELEKPTFKDRLVKMFKKKLIKKDVDLDGKALPAEQDPKIIAARRVQLNRLKNKTFYQKIFGFIDSVELELFTSIIDIGGVGASHPYFLHTSFQRGEGRVFLTRDGCPSLDIFRTVAEMTLDNIDIRMAQMDSKLTETQFMRNASLRDRAQLLFRGRDSTLGHDFDNPQSSDLIRDFGILVDGKHRSKAHLVFYKDSPNIYAGEEVVRGRLPTTGFELLVDSPEIQYGPWLEYCRFQLWQFFLPPNYRPLEQLKFEVGSPRPNASFEFFVEFIRETKIFVPFKRRSAVPSPPFGIKDSGERGYLSASIGAGSQYIQPGFYLLPNETRQDFQSLFISNNISVRTNCVQGKDSLFAEVESLQFFLDRQDDILWNGQKLWNILPKLSGAKLYFYFCYVDFFLDLLNDWQFTAQMYHNVPLTTELFNTYDRVVKFFIPNVKRFEVFVESNATLLLNINNNNVVFSDDPNDLQYNTFAKLVVNTATFSMVLPADQYQLSYENEIVRPIRVSVRDIKAFLLLPPTHPLYSEISADIPWAVSDRCDVKGLFSLIVGNQSVPQDRYNLNPSTGRTRLHNYFNLEIEFQNTFGTLMAPHILCLLNAFHNIFLDHMLTIHPDELFWLLAKLQSNATTGENKRKEFKQFLEMSQPAGNDLEICVTVKLVNTQASLASSLKRNSPKLTLRTGVLTFCYSKQFAVTNTSVSITPVTLRVVDPRHPTGSEKYFLCVGDISVGLVKHFGRMPLKPKIHDSMDIKVGGVTFSFALEQILTIVSIVKAVLEHLKLEDPNMELHVDKARAVAELAAETVKRSDRSHRDATGLEVGSPLTPNVGEHAEMENFKPKKRKKVFFLASSSSSDSDKNSVDPGGYTSFANQVSFDSASGFAKFMEECNKADDDSKDYGLFFTFVSVVSLNGRVRVGDAGWISVDVPSGISIAQSTLNDGNSNNRLSLAVKDVSVHGLVPLGKVQDLEKFPTDHVNEKFVEVLHLQTSLCARHYTAFPFDGSLENHMYKQQQFIRTNDYEELINFRFFESKTPPPTPGNASNAGETASPAGPPTQLRQNIVESTTQRLKALVESTTSSSSDDSWSEASSNHVVKQKTISSTDASSEPGTQTVQLSQESGDSASSFTDSPVAEVVKESSWEQFETCQSVSEASDSFFMGSTQFDHPFDEDSPLEEGIKPSEPPTQMPVEFSLQEEIPQHKFYRIYFSTSCGESGSLLDYGLKNKKDRNNNVHFHGPLPNTAFILLQYPEEFPEYVVAKDFYENLADGADHSWFYGCADNRKRSLQGSTTKHLHVEVTEPVTVFLSKEIFPLAAVAANTVLQKFREDSSMGNLKSSTAVFDENSPVQLSVNTTKYIKDHKKGKKSRTRSQQKRWQWEDILVSGLIPCVEIKLVTALAVPAYNLPKESPVTGMYSTTLAIQNVKLVLGYNRPPSGVESTTIISKKLSASLSLAYLSIITQIEYEPIVREGKLLVDAPSIILDETKDNIGIIYVAKVRGRGKRDVVRGTDGGACSVLVDTVGVHITKDYLSYMVSLLALCNSIQTEFSDTISGDLLAFRNQSSSASVKLSSTRHHTSSASFAGGRSNEKGKSIQGKGNIRLFRVVLINTYKHGRCVKLDLQTSSVFEIERPMTNFVILTPRTKEQYFQVQFIGDVDVFRVKLYPSVLHCLNTSSFEGAPFLQKTEDSLESNRVTSEASIGEGKLLILYNGTFTLYSLDISLLYSTVNFLQLKGKRLTGFAESRTDKVSSRECVQTDVLTEAISERLKERLRSKARAARERARESRYASPPSVTGQLQLKSTASFFVDQLMLQYVADMVMPREGNPGDGGSKREAPVIVAAIDQVAIAAQFTDQFDINGDQVSMEASVQRVYSVFPYRAGQEETVHPQIQQIITAWKLAAQSLRNTSVNLAASTMHSPKKSAQKVNLGKNSAIYFCLMAKNIEGTVGLPQNISQKFFLPQLSLFLQTSSNGRVGAKVHAHPFSVTSKSNTLDNYKVSLPHMYLIYAHDPIKLTCSIMVETVAITVTPLFINHTLLSIEKIKDLVVTAKRTVPLGALQTDTAATSPPEYESEPQKGKRQSFLFLLKGLRFSYVTSMTNLRFSIKSLNAKAETSVSSSFSLLDWVVHVTRVQVALVDRDDHDQMTAREKNSHAAMRVVPKRSIPLGGFIWGSAEFSVTLSSGKTNYNTEVQETLRRESLFQSCTPALRKTLLETVGHSTYRWIMSVYSPLVVLRIGLDSLLKQCLEETQADIWELKNAATEEGIRLRAMLSKEKTFKKLQAHKKRYDALIRKTETAHEENVRKAAEKVVRDASFRRRNAIGEEGRDMLQLLRMASEHRFITTVTNFLVVVPFGDASYKNILESNSDFFACGKSERHIHSASCLKRKNVIPTLALKVRIDEITFTCGIESVRQFAPVILKDSSKNFVTSQLRVTGRLFANKLIAYFSFGTPCPNSTTLRDFLEETTVFGGIGILTSKDPDELNRSRNTLQIDIVETSFHVDKKDDVLSVGSILDISGPKLSVSSRVINIISQLKDELPSSPSLSKLNTREEETSVSEMQSQVDCKPSTPTKGTRSVVYVVDISARLGIGSLRVFSFSQPQKLPTPAESVFTRKFTHSTRKKKKSERMAKVVTPLEEEQYSAQQKAKHQESSMSCILTLPLPAIVTQVAGKRRSNREVDDEVIVRCEIRAGVIEVGPSIATFFRDVEHSLTRYVLHKQESEKSVLSKVHELEGLSSSTRWNLYAPIADFLVPLPRAYASELFRKKMAFFSSGRTSQRVPASQRQSTVQCMDQKKEKSFISVHLSLLQFTLLLTSEPLTSTNFTVFLGDGGSVDLLIKTFKYDSERLLHCFQRPESIVIVNVRRFKTECQTKLEVKSMEVFLPEGELLISKRTAPEGVVNTIAVNLPFNVEGTDPNLILRVPHIAQLFTVYQLWTSVVGEAIYNVKSVLKPKEDSSSTSKDQALFLAQTGSNEKKMAPACVRTLAVVNVSYGLCHVDLGTGNSHQILFGTGRLAVELKDMEQQTGVNLLRCHISKFTTKSEGVLAGVVSIGDIFIQGFAIENAYQCENFLRSPEGRTFRGRLIVKHVHVGFKERQLKDVFECKSTLLDINAMDGVGVDGYTTCDMEALLSSANLGVTPSTVPAFLTFIKGVSYMVAEQKRVANERLKESKVSSDQTGFISGQIKEVLNSWERRRSTAVRSSKKMSDSTNPFSDEKDEEVPEKDPRLNETGAIPFFGNVLCKVPCGQLRFTLQETTIILGAVSSSEATTGCVVSSFPRARLSFAECPSPDYVFAKKMLVIETHNVELYRPGSYKVVIMGFRGENYFEFYTKQDLGSPEVFFTLLLKQTHPWTGNPRFRDFEEMISLIKSFADKKNADVFQKFGRVDANLNASPPPSVDSTPSPQSKPSDPHTIEIDETDPRILKPLRSANFSPQLRFGGDVSVNTEVILNWIGITENMLPNVLNSKLCDGLEGFLSNFSNMTSERTKE